MEILSKGALMYYKDAQSLKELTSLLIKQLGISENIYEQKIKDDWAEIVGEIAASKISVNFLKDKLLHLESSASVWSNELVLRKAEIIEKINSKYHNDIVQNIRIR